MKFFDLQIKFLSKKKILWQVYKNKLVEKEEKAVWEIVDKVDKVDKDEVHIILILKTAKNRIFPHFFKECG